MSTAIDKAPADPMSAERILVALGMLREATAMDVCRALGVDPLGGDYVTVCQRLQNMRAMGMVSRFRREYESARLYALTDTGCELAMMVPTEVAA